MTIPSSGTIQNLAREHVVPGMFPTGLVDQFIRKVPFQALEMPGELVDWNIASPAPSVSPYAAAGTLPATATDAVAPPRTGTLKRIGDVAEIDYFQQTAACDPADPLWVEVEMKRAGVVRQLGVQVIKGDGAGNNLEGLYSRSTGGQVITAATPTKEQLHQLVTKVRPSDGTAGAGADCIVAHERVVRYIVKLLEDAAGDGLGYRMDDDLGVPVPHFHGIPVYVGQQEVVLPANLTKIWALKLHGPTGVRVLHAGGSPSEFGIRTVEVPLQSTVSKRGTFVGGYYTVLVPEDESIAQISDVDVSTLGVPA